MRDAKAGIPPKSYIVLSKVIENCTTKERKHLPRDTYGFVIYDVEKIHPGDSSQGRKYFWLILILTILCVL